jgi:hypothetical protein
MSNQIEHSIQLVFAQAELAASVMAALETNLECPLEALLASADQAYTGPLPHVSEVDISQPEPQLLLIHFSTETPPSSDLVKALLAGPWDSYWIYRLLLGTRATIHEFDSRDDTPAMVYRYQVDKPHTWDDIPESLMSRFHDDDDAAPDQH